MPEQKTERRVDGRRAEDLTVGQQAEVVKTLTAFGELSENRAEELSALIQLISGCQSLMSACDFTIAIRDERRRAQVVAASSEAVKLIDERQLEDGDGPLVSALDLASGILSVSVQLRDERWIRFGILVRSIGFQTTYAIPLRTQSEIVGVLSVYSRDVDGIPASPLEWICSLANGAAKAVGHRRSISELNELTAQLQFALNSRILIEQSKGMIAGKMGISVDEAFDVLRQYSRDSSTSIHGIAEDVLAGRISTFDLRTRTKKPVRPG